MAIKKSNAQTSGLTIDRKRRPTKSRETKQEEEERLRRDYIHTLRNISLYVNVDTVSSPVERRFKFRPSKKDWAKEVNRVTLRRRDTKVPVRAKVIALSVMSFFQFNKSKRFSRYIDAALITACCYKQIKYKGLRTRRVGSGKNDWPSDVKSNRDSLSLALRFFTEDINEALLFMARHDDIGIAEHPETKHVNPTVDVWRAFRLTIVKAAKRTSRDKTVFEGTTHWRSPSFTNALLGKEYGTVPNPKGRKTTVSNIPEPVQQFLDDCHPDEYVVPTQEITAKDVRDNQQFNIAGGFTPTATSLPEDGPDILVKVLDVLAQIPNTKSYKRQAELLGSSLAASIVDNASNVLRLREWILAYTGPVSNIEHEIAKYNAKVQVLALIYTRLQEINPLFIQNDLALFPSAEIGVESKQIDHQVIDAEIDDEVEDVEVSDIDDDEVEDVEVSDIDDDDDDEGYEY